MTPSANCLGASLIVKSTAAQAVLFEKREGHSEEGGCERDHLDYDQEASVVEERTASTVHRLRDSRVLSNLGAYILVKYHCYRKTWGCK